MELPYPTPPDPTPPIEQENEKLLENPQLQIMREQLEKVKRQMEEWKRVDLAKIVFENSEQEFLVLQKQLKILRMRNQDDKKGLEEKNVELRQELGQAKEELRSNSHKIYLL